MRKVHNTGGPEDGAADRTRGAALPAAETAVAATPADPPGAGGAERPAREEASAVESTPDDDTHGWRLTAALIEVGPPPAERPGRSALSGEESLPTWWRLLTEKVREGRAGLSRRESAVVRGLVRTVESRGRVGNLNASRLQFDRVIEAAGRGDVIAVEAPGLYFVDYGGRVTFKELLPEDRRGMEFASGFTKGLRAEYPDAKIVIVGLYDEYSSNSHNSPEGTVPWPFDPDRVREFRESVPSVLQEAEVILPRAQNRLDHIEFWESEMVPAAQNFINDLTRRGYTIKSNGRIDYVNPKVENPEHFRFPLRNENGRLACVILDLAKVLSSMEILRAAHPGREVRLVVALPEYAWIQQDRLWELLLLFGVQYHEYHNVFYPVDSPPGEVTLAAQRLSRSTRRP